MVFHAGTERDAAGRVVTAGGRVLGVTAVGTDLAAARDRAYEAVSRIRWNGAYASACFRGHQLMRNCLMLPPRLA